MARRGHFGPIADLDDGPSTGQRFGHCQGPDEIPDQWAFKLRNEGNTAETLGFDVSRKTAQSSNLTFTARKFKFKVRRLPSANNCFLFNVGETNPGVALLINTDGTIHARGLGAVTAFPGEAYGTVGVAVVGQWHQIRMAHASNTTGPNPGGGSCTVEFDGVQTVNASSGITTGQGQGVGFWNGTFGMRVNRDRFGDPSSSQADVDFDCDYSEWVGDDAALPDLTTRITPLRMQAAGTYQEFSDFTAHDWRLRNIWPDRVTTNARVGSSTNGQRETFLVEDMGARGIGTIKGAMLHAYCSTGPFSLPPDVVVRRNGSDTFIALGFNVGSSTVLTHRLDTTGWAATDTIEIGFRAQSQLFAFTTLCLSIEHDGPGPAAEPSDFRSAEVTWTGTGAAQTVALPFSYPDLIIWWPRTAGQSGGMWARRLQSGHLFSQFGNYRNDIRVSNDGASLDIVLATAQGPNVNTVVYDALVIRDPNQRIIAQGGYADVNSAGRDDLTVPYTFDGASVAADGILTFNESISSGGTIVWRGPGHTGDNCQSWTGNAGLLSDRIQAIGAGTFQAGLTLHNQSSQVGFLAFRRTGFFSTVLCDVFQYTGNGVAGDRVIACDVGGAAVKWSFVEPHAGVMRAMRGPNMTGGKENDGTDGGAYANSITGHGANSITVNSALNSNGVVYSVLVFAYGDDLALPLQKVTQVFLEVLTDEDGDDDPPPDVTGCVGGGTVASGTNPVDGESLAGAQAIHVWMEVTVGATTYEWAKVPINAATRKAPRVLSFGRLVRALTGANQGFETPSVTVRLSDYDRLLRSLQASATLHNRIAKIYMADEATLRSTASPPPAPWLVFVGVIRAFSAEPDLTYSLVLEDKLTMAMSAAFAQERLLPAVVVDDRISDQNPLEKVHGIPVPLLYGSLSDEDQADPVGTVPCPMINAITLSGHEDLGNIYRFMIGKGVTTNVQSVFRADPLSGTPPTERSKATASEYGTSIWAPWRTNFIYDPQQFDLIDAASRFSFLYMDQTHPGAELGRSGRIPIVVNCCGFDTVGDGTGNTINALPLQFLHFLNNFVAQSALLDWLPIADLESGISLFDTATFDNVKAIAEDRIAGGYIGAFMVGHSGRQVTLRQLIAQFCRSGDFDLGVNRNGQLILVMLDRTTDASGAALFTDQDDVIEGSLRIDPKTDEVENRIRYVYKRNYVPALQQVNPEVGSRALREPFDAEWISGEQLLDDEPAQAALGEVRESERLELDMVRDQATAEDVAAQRLALRASARAEVTFVVTCNRGMDLELGQLIKLTHFQGIGGSGWTGRRLQVRRHEVDLDRLTVQITARDVDDLLA